LKVHTGVAIIQFRGKPTEFNFSSSSDINEFPHTKTYFHLCSSLLMMMEANVIV